MRNLGLLALVNLMWAIQFPASRIAAQELQPMTLTWFAMLLATVLMLPVAWYERREIRQAAPPSWLDRYGRVVLLGISGSLVAQMCLNWGLERSPASNASVINLTVPVLMTVLAALLLGERMSALRWAAFALSIPGVLLASDIRWSEANFFENRYFLGNALVFLSCWGSAFYNVYSKRVLDWMGPAQLLVSTFAVSLLALLPAMLIYEPAPVLRLQRATTASLAGLVIIGVVSLAFSMFLYFRVLGEVDATQASLSIYFLPVFGVVLSGATLHETISPALVGGGLLVGAGAWLVTVQEQRAKAAVRSS
jgi:drug/metabolite transporter (DMT)-like permease